MKRVAQQHSEPQDKTLLSCVTTGCGAALTTPAVLIHILLLFHLLILEVYSRDSEELQWAEGVWVSVSERRGKLTFTQVQPSL